jgi:hypothetical protein
MDSIRGRATLLSAVAGSLGIAMYMARSFFTLPDPIEIAFYALFGPALVLAFFGLAPLLAQGKAPLSAYVGSLFGIIGGAVNMCFAVVQMCNLSTLQPAIQNATDPLVREDLRRVLAGVFTVQNGLNITMDFFIDVAAFFWAYAMWHHPRYGRGVALLAPFLVGTHFVLKAYTFPVPPREAGFFDAGPMVGVWFTIVSVMTWRAWMLDRQSGKRR